MDSLVAKQLYLALQRIRGEPVSFALADVLRTDFLSVEELHQIRSDRQLAQLRFAIDHVPYYKVTYAPFSRRIRSARTWVEVNELMQDLPILGKDTVRKNPQAFHAEVAGLRTHLDRTSGSSGTPLVFRVDQTAWAYRHALMYRTMVTFGVEIGEPYGAFFGLHWNKRRRLHVMIRDHFLNRVRVSAYEIEPRNCDKHLRAIRKQHPTHLWGYPSAIYDFCLMLRDRGLDLHDLKLKAVFLTGEPLRSYQRELIGQVTGSRCVDTYGSAEGGYHAAECPDGSLHLCSEATWLQVRPTSSGERGDAIVTDMMLRAVPLIRYAIGDEVVLRPGPCSCGRAHEMLLSVEGRSGAAIVLPNGRTISPHLPRSIFWHLAGEGVVRQYRFVHRNSPALELYLVVGHAFRDEHLKLIEQESRKAFGSDVALSIRVVDKLDVLPNAKHQDFVFLSG
ncbi:MAG: hypothetical protein ABI811_06045 [Acidobacteriota bacterium]